VWMPQRAPDGWIVLTGDRGKGGRTKGAKLPFLCEQHGVTHIMLGPSAHHLPSDKKIVAIASVWDEIVKLPDAPRGSAYLLSVTRGHARLTLKRQQP